MATAQRTLDETRDEDFDTGVYPTDGRPELELAEIERRARAALAGSPAIPGPVVWARFEERWLRRG
jgi:hypothetical protein